jgi:glycosyltransferase involved in cell wall biosynthesis
MCTYNGEEYLEHQLNSIEKQTYHNWNLVVSDDFSNDNTLKILYNFKNKWKNKVEILNGAKNVGFCKNFQQLICNPLIKADYYAFCDQDDIWLPQKLEKAITILNRSSELSKPLLYCGRTIYFKDDMKIMGTSPLFIYPKTFRNAIVQSVAGGNTMLFDDKAKKELEKAGIKNVISHDWWVYILITALDGEVYYDNNSYVLYRQHKNSVVGRNNTLYAHLIRAFKLLKGEYKEWNKNNLTALTSILHMIPSHNRLLIEYFFILQNALTIRDRIRIIQICGFYRQTRYGTYSLYLAAILNRL